MTGAGNDNEKLVMMVLFHDGRGELSANAALAFVADGKDVDGFHGSKGEKRAAQAAPRSSLLHRLMVLTMWALLGSQRGMGMLP